MRAEAERNDQAIQDAFEGLAVGLPLGRPSFCRAHGPMHLMRRSRQPMLTQIQIGRAEKEDKLKTKTWTTWKSLCAQACVKAMIDQGKPYVYRFRVPFDRQHARRTLLYYPYCQERHTVLYYILCNIYISYYWKAGHGLNYPLATTNNNDEWFAFIICPFLLALDFWLFVGFYSLPFFRP